MVGDLRDKVVRFGGRSGPSPSREIDAAPRRPRIEIELAPDQLDRILQQWSEGDRNEPTEVVFTVGPDVVGRMEAVSSLFVKSAGAGGGPA